MVRSGCACAGEIVLHSVAHMRTVRYIPVHYSTTQRRAAQCSTWYRTMLRIIQLYGKVQADTEVIVQECIPAQCHTEPFLALPCSTTQLTVKCIRDRQHTSQHLERTAKSTTERSKVMFGLFPLVQQQHHPRNFSSPTHSYQRLKSYHVTRAHTHKICNIILTRT